MKKRYLILFLIVLSASAYAQKAVSTKAPVQSATVYLQGAEVTGTAKVNVAGGQQDIIFEGLSNFINPQSMQVMTSNENITILSAVYQLNYLRSKEKDPVYILLKDSLESYTFDLTKIVNQKSALQEEQAMILANKKVGGENTGLNVIELQKAADFFRQRLLQVKNDISLLELKEKKLNEIITRYRGQVADYDRTQNFPVGELVVRVAASAPASANFRLSYFIPQAGWNPVYDIRVKDVNSPAKIAYKAQIHQNSGVNWKDVKLTVSTGNPTQGGTRPVLYPWFVNFYQRQPVYLQQNRSAGQAPAAAPSKAEMDEGAMEAYGYQPPPVQVAENQLSVEFQVNTPYDIPSDGKTHLVALKEYDVNAKYKYYAAPKIDKDAFLLARITDWEQLQLLPGNSNIFFEGAYVGQAYLNPLETEDTLDISLGRDKKIIIQREKIKDFDKEKLIGTNKTETFAFDISVRNTKNTPVEIEVVDQVPVSQHNEIEVKTEEISAGNFNPATGEVKWNIALKPAETKKIRLVYSVKYPKDKRINL